MNALNRPNKVFLCALSIICFLCPNFANGDTAIVGLRENEQIIFQNLSSTRQQEIQSYLQSMDSYDREYLFLDPTGHFYVVEDSLDKIIADQKIPDEIVNAHVEPDSAGLPTPTGDTPEGVPIHHSLPGAKSVLYINFIGGTITGKVWNASYNVPTYKTLPYDLDGINGFSLAEQNSMSSIWARVAEDYRAWSIDVTTERPVYTPYVLEALVTKNVDATGIPMPEPSAGGIAYLQIYGFMNNNFYLPALVYYNNLLSGREDCVAEALAHEIGHNFGMMHDGVKGVSTYYSGLGVGEASWAPIMGSAYFKAVTQFSRGEYTNPSNTEPDIEMLTETLGLREINVGSSLANATPIGKDGVISTSSTIVDRDKVHMYSILSSGGNFLIDAKTFRSAQNTNTVGNNLDLALRLLDSTGKVLKESNPQDSSSASLSLNNLSGGTYYLEVKSVGNTVTPYSNYGSNGQYTITGTFGSCITAAPTVTISPDKQSLLAGKTAVYNVSVKNNDANDCSQNSISLRAVAPSGWTTALSAPQVTLAPGATGSVTLQVSSLASSTAGDYTTTISGTSATNSSLTGSATAIYSVSSPPCTRANPTVTVNPSSTQWVKGGQSATYKISVKNNDGLNCQSSPFNLSSTSSPGITATLTPQNLSLAPATEGVVTLQLSTTTSIGAGTYMSTVRAINSIESNYNGSGKASLGISTPSSPVVIYEASMATQPSGWTVGGNAAAWSHGTPTSTFDPKGFPVIGNYLKGTGLYPEPLNVNAQILSDSFSTVGFSNLQLEFDRYLGVESDDRVTVVACASGTCALLWQNSGAVKDVAWQRIRYDIPNLVQGKPVTLIGFGIGPTKSNGTQLTNSFGWNIKKVSVSGTQVPASIQ